MSSSGGRRRGAGESAVAAEPEIETSAAGAADTGTNGAADHELQDPWFEPGPKVPGHPLGQPDGATDSDDAGDGQASDDPADRSNGFDPDDIGSTTAEWFLPAGRAGLLPDAMTVATDDAEIDPRSAYQRAETSGAPPWAGEAAEPVAATLPPWETGPWSGPGSYRSKSAHEAGAGQHQNGRPGSDQPGGAGGLSSPRVILVAGLVPLVAPGLALGALGLGRSSVGEPARRASIVALTASLAWAVVIIVIVAVIGSGSSAGSCTYPTAAQQAYQRAMGDLSSTAPMQVRATQLSAAVSTVNASAAAAGQIPVRSALAAMANDLEQARMDLAAGRAVPATLRQHLAADGTALTRACPR
jgi:hypothetical protein